MNGFLTKPIRLKELSRELGKWLPRVEVGAHPVLDESCIEERWDNDRAGFAFVLQIFLDELKTRLSTLGEHLHAHDLSKLRHEAHAIKGGASNVGAEALSSAAARLEHASSMDQRDGTLDSLHAELMRAADSFREATKKHLNPNSGESG